MKVSEFTFDSSTAHNKIFTRLYEPDGEPKAVLQISHGMAEHSALYKPFCEYMAQRGFVVVINDHLGHGRSVTSGALYGHFGEKGGLYNVVEDQRNLQSIMREKYPELPYFLMGHSMGSFIAREFAAAYGNSLTAVVFMGTSAGISTAMWKAERTYLNMLKKAKGAQAKIPSLEKIATGPYNKKFKPNRTPNDWICTDPAVVDRYTADPLCGGDATVGLSRELLRGLGFIQKRTNLKKMNKALPVFFIAGHSDPVGAMGKGVEKAASRFCAEGMQQVALHLYDGRHEILNEPNREEIYGDVWAFLLKTLKK